jgi:hypothetical protein
VVAILKMETGRNFAMSGINSGHHNLPTYEIGQTKEYKIGICCISAARSIKQKEQRLVGSE